MHPASTPVNQLLYPTLASVLLASGIAATGSFFLYEVTKTRHTRSITQEAMLAAVGARMLMPLTVARICTGRQQRMCRSTSILSALVHKALPAATLLSRACQAAVMRLRPLDLTPACCLAGGVRAAGPRLPLPAAVDRRVRLKGQ
jgi:hypothetical protein